MDSGIGSDMMMVDGVEIGGPQRYGCVVVRMAEFEFSSRFGYQMNLLGWCLDLFHSDIPCCEENADRERGLVSPCA
jgi:hypothetical protein